MEIDKKGRYIPTNKKNMNSQLKEFKAIQKEMEERFLKGYKQYGDYTIETSKDNALKEFREEMVDSMNHLFFLYYRVLKNKNRK